MAANNLPTEDALPMAARRHLMAYTTVTMPTYRPAGYHYTLARKLEQLESGEITRLIVTMPPRHGKSELCSIRLPSWYLGRHPEREVILASYALDLARDFAGDSRDVVNSDTYRAIFDTRLKPDQKAAHRWKTDQGGGLVAAGVDGPITGRGANLMIVDDPVKNREEADSKTYQDKAWRWWQSTAYPRLEKPGAVLVVMTHWQEDDLCGRLMNGPEHYEVVNFPAISEDGLPLWPEKYNLADYERIRTTIGPQEWNALYQQSPTPAEGNIFKAVNFMTYSRLTLPPFARIIQSWDTAFSKKSTADYSVCSTWGEAPAGYYLLDVWKGRPEYHELKVKALALAAAYDPAVILIENKGSGQSLCQELRSETSLPIIPIGVSQSKENRATQVEVDEVSRAYTVQGLVDSGQVWIPETSSWVADFLHEVCSFPNGAHDDQVDSMTQALNYLRRSRGSDPGYLSIRHREAGRFARGAY